MKTGILLWMLPVAILCATYNWQEVETVLNDAIADGAFPGCVAHVENGEGVLFSKGFGRLTYGIPPPYGENSKMTSDTMFDMASCTKVVATTSAAALLYQKGYLNLEESAAKYIGSDFSTKGKGVIKIKDLMLHQAGYPPDPEPNYWNPEFPCPNNKDYHPKMDFSCKKLIFESLLNQSLEYTPTQEYIYSDLSMMTMMYVIGSIAKSNNLIGQESLNPACHDDGDRSSWMCYFEAYCRKYVFEPLNMKDTGFLPDKSEWSRCAPCENDTIYTHKTIQGEVSDGNAYASGGIDGHAGLFSTAPDISILARKWLFPPVSSDTFLSAATVKLFTEDFKSPISSRVLGWNTNDPNLKDEGWNHTCGDWSSRTFLHIGYTGTQICIDPEHEIFTILLTNRVYPSFKNLKILEVRKQYNDAVKEAVFNRN